MEKENITKSIMIEDLVEQYPFSVEYLARKGIRCIVCGEPLWGTLEEAAKEKGFNNNAIDEFVKELNELNNNFEAKVYNNFREINTDKTDV
ncbi:MAG: DUF1858 domain-containing protein [Bacteroidales bacterium]|nr:DUF1858 domain-containing protein [Bacteroidales bacterium]